MWTQSAEEKSEELRFTKKQLEELSDKTMVGVGIITNVLTEAMNQGLIVKKNTIDNNINCRVRCSWDELPANEHKGLSHMHLYQDHISPKLVEKILAEHKGEIGEIKL